MGFLGSLLGKVAGGAVGKLVGGGTGKTIGSTAGGILGGFLPFDAGGPQMGQAQGQSQGQEQLGEVELLGFWSVLRKIGRGIGTGVDIGRQAGLFDAGGPQMSQGGQQGSVDPQMAQLLQQAMPALQALAAQGQQRGYVQ